MANANPSGDFAHSPPMAVVAEFIPECLASAEAAAHPPLLSVRERERGEEERSAAAETLVK